MPSRLNGTFFNSLGVSSNHFKSNVGDVKTRDADVTMSSRLSTASRFKVS